MPFKTEHGLYLWFMSNCSTEFCQRLELTMILFVEILSGLYFKHTPLNIICTELFSEVCADHVISY